MTQLLWPTTLQPPALRIEVPGKPAAQGSLTLWKGPDGTERAKHPPHTVEHRNLTIGMLRDTWGPRAPITRPVTVRLGFQFPYLRKHYRTGKSAHQLRDDCPEIHCDFPDLDKLVRLVFDALTIAGVWADDKQACDLRASKRWGTKGVTTILLMTEEG